ncbi:hypothetical protein AY599_12395 [Leptolyngbya valderiana BDU 20041]|nr:hypothetical protein AY599_12395 [Leptolyngbya valderiana BDU 20041]
MSPYYLYKITTPNQKVYIGVTDDPQERWQHHCQPSSQYKSAIGAAIQKYGKERVNFEILRKFDSEEEALEAEAKIVNKDFVKSKNTYNLCRGGGKPPKNKANAKAIKIDGIVYPSIHEAAIALGYSRAQIDRKIALKLFEFEFVEEAPKNSELKQKGKQKRDNLVRSPRVVYFNGETFPSYREACQKYGLSKDELLKCRKALGRDHITLKEVLSLRVGKKPIEIDGVLYSSRQEAKEKTGLSMYKILEIAKGYPSQNRKRKRVAKICLETDEVLQIFETMTQAAQAVGAASASKICMCCKGQRQKAHGYKWSYWEGSLDVANQGEHKRTNGAKPTTSFPNSSSATNSCGGLSTPKPGLS